MCCWWFQQKVATRSSSLTPRDDSADIRRRARSAVSAKVRTDTPSSVRVVTVLRGCSCSACRRIMGMFKGWSCISPFICVPPNGAAWRRLMPHTAFARVAHTVHTPCGMADSAPAGTPARPDWLLVDGSSLIFRAFFGVPQMVVSPDGRPVNAVRGFLDYLARFLIDRRPRHLAVATDEDWRPAFRVEALPSYKTHRTAEPIPPQLEPQMPIIMEVLPALSIPAVGAAGYEAEGVSASLLPFAAGRVAILNGDRAP